MHYNHAYKREQIRQKYLDKGIDLFDTDNIYSVYINLCIHPYKWESVFANIRERPHINQRDYFALLGTIKALLINTKRAKKESTRMSAELAPDFIDFIRNDRVGNPWKFILSMRRYVPRYLIMRGLQDFGIDWRDLAFDHMGAKYKPQPKSYHTLFTNLYLRTIVKALGVFAAVREPHDADYECGVNDVASLIKKESNSTKCKSPEILERTYLFLRESLPSWSPQVRGQVTYYLSNLLPVTYLVEKRLYGRQHENIIGVKNDW